MASIELLLKEAKNLKPEERFRLADALLASLDITDEEIQTKWVKEADARYEAHEKRELESVSWDEIKKRFADWKQG